MTMRSSWRRARDRRDEAPRVNIDSSRRASAFFIPQISRRRRVVVSRLCVWRETRCPVAPARPVPGGPRARARSLHAELLLPGLRLGASRDRLLARTALALVRARAHDPARAPPRRIILVGNPRLFPLAWSFWAPLRAPDPLRRAGRHARRDGRGRARADPRRERRARRPRPRRARRVSARARAAAVLASARPDRAKRVVAVASTRRAVPPRRDANDGHRARLRRRDRAIPPSRSRR